LLCGTTKLPDRKLVVQYSRAKLEKWECAVIWQEWRLVHGKELYNVSEDRAQEKDLSASRPEIVEQLRAHYEEWWKGLGTSVNEFVSTSLGAEAQPVVTLTSSDWQDVYADNARHVRQAAGGPRGGPWNVRVERAGEYEISVRRWPPELELPLSAPNGEESRALPIAAAKLMVAGQTLSAKASSGDTAVKFVTKLPAGSSQLHAWFMDANDQDVCGAFYTTVQRVR